MPSFAGLPHTCVLPREAFEGIRMGHEDLFPHPANLRLTSWEMEGAMDDKAEKNNTEFQIKMLFYDMQGSIIHPK